MGRPIYANHISESVDITLGATNPQPSANEGQICLLAMACLKDARNSAWKDTRQFERQWRPGPEKPCFAQGASLRERWAFYISLRWLYCRSYDVRDRRILHFLQSLSIAAITNILATSQRAAYSSPRRKTTHIATDERCFLGRYRIGLMCEAWPLRSKRLEVLPVPLLAT
jgi:hypothetical protein